MIPHTLPGKDAPLEKSRETLEDFFSSLDLDLTPARWLQPVDDCWSVHIKSGRCPSLYTNGKGRTRLASLVSGLAEFYERLVSGFFFTDLAIGENDDNAFLYDPDEVWFPVEDNKKIPIHSADGRQLLSSGLRAIFDPDMSLRPEHLVDCNSPFRPGEICGLPFQDIACGGTIYIPSGLLSNLYVSNGLAAGNSRTEATAQAISEIIERHTKNIIIRNGISLPDVPDSHLRSFPRLQAIVDSLKKSELLVRVKDGSLGGQFPVICVLVTDCRNGGVYCGFGSNLRFEIAVERTLTELLQGRSLDMLRTFAVPSHEPELVADPFNIESHFIDSDGLLAWTMFRDTPNYTFHSWDFTGSTRDECQRLVSMIQEWGFSPLRMERSIGGFYCCRIIIPSMSEIYPMDDLLWNNRWQGAAIRDTLLHPQALKVADLENLLDQFEEYGLSDHQSFSDCCGVLFDTQSAWNGLLLGEIRLYCYLGLSQQEEAQNQLSWCIDSGMIDPKKKKHYQLLDTLLRFQLGGEELDQYLWQLKGVYGEEQIRKAQDILSGRNLFPDLESGKSWQEISSAQKELVQLSRQCRALLKDNII